MLELVASLPAGDRFVSDIIIDALNVLLAVTSAPAARRLVVGALVPGAAGAAAGAPRSGVAVLLSLGSSAGSLYASGEGAEALAIALQALSNCIAPPPSYAALLPGGGGGGAAAAEATAAAALVAATPMLTPADGRRGAAAQAPAASPLEAAATPSGAAPPLGEQLAGSYAYARACLRACSGLRALLGLLQVRPAFAGAQLHRIRACAARCLLGMCETDAGMRHMLTRLGLGRTLAELVQAPAAPAGGRASCGASRSSSSRSPPPPASGGRTRSRSPRATPPRRRCSRSSAPRSRPPRR
jgi:hypothetical protein